MNSKVRPQSILFSCSCCEQSSAMALRLVAPWRQVSYMKIQPSQVGERCSHPRWKNTVPGGAARHVSVPRSTIPIRKLVAHEVSDGARDSMQHTLQRDSSCPPVSIRSLPTPVSEFLKHDALGPRNKHCDALTVRLL